jgi:hypothetical protein
MPPFPLLALSNASEEPRSTCSSQTTISCSDKEEIISLFRRYRTHALLVQYTLADLGQKPHYQYPSAKPYRKSISQRT